MADRGPLGHLARVADGIWRAPDLPRLIAAALGSMDERLASIERLTAETAETTPLQLEAIRSLHPELVRNRDAAERLGPEVGALREEISDIGLMAPLLEEMRGLRQDIAALELLREVVEEIRTLRQELREVGEVVGPLAPATEAVGRIADRLPGSGR